MVGGGAVFVELPEVSRAIFTAADETLLVGGKREGAHLGLMAAESAHDGSRFQIPKADNLVGTTREQVLAIGQKLHAPVHPR